MSNNFDKEFRNLYRNIYHYHTNDILFNICVFINFTIMNEKNIVEHPHKNNIKKIINQEMEKLISIKKMCGTEINYNNDEYDII